MDESGCVFRHVLVCLCECVYMCVRARVCLCVSACLCVRECVCVAQHMHACISACACGALSERRKGKSHHTLTCMGLCKV